MSHTGVAMRMRPTARGWAVMAGLVLLLAVSASTVLGGGGAKRAADGLHRPVAHVIDGEATFYGPGLPADAVTADGTPFDPQSATAAHPDLPFGTHVRVVRADTGTSVVVEINDRLPEADRSRIDLTVGAATVLGMRDEGRVPVRLEVLGKTGR